MLIPTHRQEAVSRAYIHTIAARCGLGCSFRDYDYGIDLTVPLILSALTKQVEAAKPRKRAAATSAGNAKTES